MIDDPNQPAWAANFFVGMPAPGGAIAVLLPIYVTLARHAAFGGFTPLVFLYTLAIAILMVSRLPVFSGKRVGKRVAPEMVLPVFVLVVAFFALLIAYPWFVLTIGTVLYLASLPFGVHRLSQVRSRGRRERRGRPVPAGSRRPHAAAEPPARRRAPADGSTSGRRGSTEPYANPASSALRAAGAALPS